MIDILIGSLASAMTVTAVVALTLFRRCIAYRDRCTQLQHDLDTWRAIGSAQRARIEATSRRRRIDASGTLPVHRVTCNGAVRDLYLN